MHQAAEEIEAILQNGEATAHRLLADDRYAEHHRYAVAAQAREEAKAAAQQAAEQAVLEAQKRIERAEKRLLRLRQEHAGEVDYSRRQVAVSRAESLALSNFGTIRAEVADAARVGDEARLRAFIDVTVPRLRARIAGSEISPLRSHAGELETLAREALRRLDQLEPEDIRAARKQWIEAQREAQELESSLQSINFRYSLRRGGPGPLRPPAPSYIEIDPDTGVGRRFSGGRWP